MSNSEDARQTTFCCSFSTCLQIFKEFRLQLKTTTISLVYIYGTWKGFHLKCFHYGFFYSVFEKNIVQFCELFTNHPRVFDLHDALYHPLNLYFSMVFIYLVIALCIVHMYLIRMYFHFLEFLRHFKLHICTLRSIHKT